MYLILFQACELWPYMAASAWFHHFLARGLQRCSNPWLPWWMDVRREASFGFGSKTGGYPNCIIYGQEKLGNMVSSTILYVLILKHMCVFYCFLTHRTQPIWCSHGSGFDFRRTSPKCRCGAWMCKSEGQGEGGLKALGLVQHLGKKVRFLLVWTHEHIYTVYIYMAHDIHLCYFYWKSHKL